MAVIRKVLELSTAYAPVHLGEPTEISGVVVYDVDHGWLMWVPDDPVESNNAQPDPTPQEYLAIQLYARRLGCDYVLFDTDGDKEVTSLPQYDW